MDSEDTSVDVPPGTPFTYPVLQRSSFGSTSVPASGNAVGDGAAAVVGAAARNSSVAQSWH
eukprot:3609163-Pleurochrysis_carterae.AAC.1